MPINEILVSMMRIDKYNTQRHCPSFAVDEDFISYLCLLKLITSVAHVEILSLRSNADQQWLDKITA
jgi:hypothetical protein